MSPGRLDADVDGYRQAAAANTPPPALESDPLVAGLSPIEQLLRVLGLAANLGDEQDNLDSAAEHAERDALTRTAAEEFAAQDDAASAEVGGVADPGTQLAQQIPQMASGIAGSLAGALSGVMQPFAQIPQQLAQGAQQAIQAGLGMTAQAGGSADLAGLDDPVLDDLDAGVDTPDDGFGLGEFGDLGGAALGNLGAGAGGGPGDGFGGGPGAGAGGAAPTALLGPGIPPSAATFPSSARSAAPVGAAAPPAAPAVGPGMAGVPMMPPTAMNAAGGADRDPAAVTKRVSVPPVRNGAPVQGRISAPPSPDDADPEGGPIRRVVGKPVAARRVIVSRGDADDPDPAGRR